MRERERERERESINLKCRPYTGPEIFSDKPSILTKEKRDKNNSVHQSTCNHAKTVHWLH